MEDKKAKVEIHNPNRLDKSEQKADLSKVKAASDKAEQREEIVKPAEIVSRADHPLFIKYGEDEIRVSPRGRVKIANVDKLDRKSLSPLIVVIEKKK